MPAAKAFARGLRCLRSTTTSAPWSRSFTISSTSHNLSMACSRKIAKSPRTCAAFTSSTLRPFSTSPIRQHGHITPPKPGEELYVTFVDKENREHKIAVSEGDNLLDIAQANDLEMEGACGGSCACSTCHVIVLDEDYYDKIPEPEDDENDMLDLAFGLTETSRLGCQVVMTKELDGLKVKLPSMTRNLQASDFSRS
ncbi:adrenodoxin-like protein, mitochondrial precursor [Xylaria nigripes]|nr:adrenodoxin-like protein, mitochondrial precursor [Xylaria nigripes]